VIFIVHYQALFKPFGHIARIFLAKDRMTGICKVWLQTYLKSVPDPSPQGFAFVNYYRKEDAAKALATVNGFGYDHLILAVEWAKPAPER
jgi:translation initiation factor 3 subunit G